jgi:lysophospholipase L1-like esterase
MSITTYKGLVPQTSLTISGDYAEALQIGLRAMADEIIRQRAKLASDGGALLGSIIADNCQTLTSGASNGTDTADNSRVGMYARRDTSLLRVVCPNFNGNEGGDGLTPITLRASIEYPAGVFTPVYFGVNGRDVVVQPAAFAVSDPIGVHIPADDLFWVRTYLTVSTGGAWPRGFAVVATDGSRGNGFESGSSDTITDKTTTGTIDGQFAFGYGVFVVDSGPVDGASVAIFGDSIGSGQADSGVDGIYNSGFLVRALDAAALPWLRMTLPGENAGATLSKRLAWASACTHAIVQYGTNDYPGGSLSTIQTNLARLWTVLATQGIKVYQTTITPRSTSTDSWATVENQTPTANSDSTKNQLNDWIRTTPAPLTGYFEVADTVESARNSGVWKAGFSDDGIHPNQTGHSTATTAIDTTHFTL